MGNTGPVIRGVNPRRNLPLRVSRKRTESNFLCAFERAYRLSVTSPSIVGRDLEISGYGIADWIWLGWRPRPESQDATAYSLESLPPRFRLYAFELKITHWRKALKQAFRYSYFADRAIVVVPPRTAEIASKYLAVFKAHSVGLWSFDARTNKIRRLFTPTGRKPRNQKAKCRAIELILGRAKLSKFSELQ